MPRPSIADLSSPPPSPATSETRPTSTPPTPPLAPGFSSREEEDLYLGPRETTTDELGPGSAAGYDDELDGGTSSRGSSPSAGESRPLSRAALKNTIKQAIKTGTGAANRLLTRSPVEREAGLWLADDEDLEGIASPLSSIAHRRGGVAGITTANPDVADAIATLIAVAGYVSKQFALRLQARAYAQAAVVQQQQAADEQAAG